MTRNALLAVMLTDCASIALAQEFPVWERLLSHYSGKTDETAVPSMKMGRHMQMSLKGDPARTRRKNGAGWTWKRARPTLGVPRNGPLQLLCDELHLG